MRHSSIAPPVFYISWRFLHHLVGILNLVLEHQALLQRAKRLDFYSQNGDFAYLGYHPAVACSNLGQFA